MSGLRGREVGRLGMSGAERLRGRGCGGRVGQGC